MTRRDGSSNTGYVKWPTYLENTGEGGMAVYLIVPESSEGSSDPFMPCIPGTIIEMTYPNSLLYPYGTKRKKIWPVYPQYDETPGASNSVCLLAAVCLGGSGGSWLDPDINQYWHCTYDDLTEEGQRLYGMLSVLYDRELVLVTVLDT